MLDNQTQFKSQISAFLQELQEKNSALTKPDPLTPLHKDYVKNVLSTDSAIQSIYSHVWKSMQDPIFGLKASYTRLHRDERDLTDTDKKVLNNFFCIMMDTETPNIKQLPKEQLDFYRLRFIAKKGKDLETSQPLASNSSMKAGTVYNADEPFEAASIRNQAARHILQVPPLWNKSNQQITEFYQKIKNEIGETREPVKVHVIVQRRDPRASDANTNYFATGFQSVLSEQLNNLDAQTRLAAKMNGERIPPAIEFLDHDILPVISRTVRSEATAVDRIVLQSKYGKSALQPGDHVIVVDDHIQAGGAMLSAYTNVKRTGAKIVGVAAFGAHPLNQKGMFNEELNAELKAQLLKMDPENNVIKTLEKEVLVPFKSLTSFESASLLALLTDGSNPQDVAKFKDILKSINHPYEVVEGEHDSLIAMAEKPQSKAEDIVSDLRKALSQVPDCVDDIRTKRVIMYDYDDTLAPEYEVVDTARALLKELGVDDDTIKKYVNDDEFKAYDRNKTPMIKDLPSKIPALREKLISLRQDSELNDKLSDMQLGQQLYRMFMPRYHAMCVNTPFVDRNDALPLLQSQNKAGTMQTIVSNKPAFRLDRRLETTPLRPFFSYVHGVETVLIGEKLQSRLPGKPKSDMLLEQLQDANVDPSAHIYFIDDKDGKQIDALDGLASHGFINRSFIHLDENAARSTKKLMDNSAGTHIYKARTLQDVQTLLNQI